MRISSSRIMEVRVEGVGDIRGIKIGSRMSRKPMLIKDLEYPRKHSLIFLDMYKMISNLTIFWNHKITKPDERLGIWLHQMSLFVWKNFSYFFFKFFISLSSSLCLIFELSYVKSMFHHMLVFLFEYFRMFTCSSKWFVKTRSINAYPKAQLCTKDGFINSKVVVGHNYTSRVAPLGWPQLEFHFSSCTEPHLNKYQWVRRNRL